MCLLNFNLNLSLMKKLFMFFVLFVFAGASTLWAQTEVVTGAVTSAAEGDEVVVTALGIKKEKREITYQTQKVNNAELTASQPTRAGSALAGKVAGLQINVQDNSVNPSTQIILRGLRSLWSDNQALIVIDDVISSIGAFNDLNPNDIADLNILKGATAAALYGSRAANGAILVTTKKGQAGEKFTVGLISSYTAEKVAYMPKFQTEYGSGWDGAYDPVAGTNWGPRFDGTLRQIGPTWPDGSYQGVPYAPVKDNLLDFFKTGNNFNNTLYLSGGNENSKFYLSVGDQRTTGIVPDDSYQRNTFRVNASQKFGKFELSLNAGFSRDKTDVVEGNIGSYDRPLYWHLLNTPVNIPLLTYTNWKTDPYAAPDGYYNAFSQNPYWIVGNNRNNQKSNRLNGNVQMSWDPLSWMNVIARVGTNTYWRNGKDSRAGHNYDPFLKPLASSILSYVIDTESQASEITEDLLVTGKYDFSNFSLKVILGASNYNYTYSSIRLWNDNLDSSEDLQGDNFGLFGDITLGYSNFIFLNISGRNDWNSTSSGENDSNFQPGFGLSFVLTDAIDALRNNDYFSFARLTASNSTVYNVPALYRKNETLPNFAPYPYGIVWPEKEKLNATEFGVNLGLLRSRIMLDASYFMTKTTSLINTGSLEGSGWEVSLGGSVIKSNTLTWEMSLNYFTQTTIVKDLAGYDFAPLTSGFGYGVFANVDMAFPQIMATTYLRDPQGRLVIDPATGFPRTNAAPQPLGRTTPKHIIGLNTSLKAYGFTLSATIDYRTGHVFYSQGQDMMEATGRSMASVSANRQDFVIPNSVIETSPGVYVENTNIPVQDGRQGYWTGIYNRVKENYVIDATAFKIRELTLTYTLPSAIIMNTPLQKVSIGLVARNLFTLLPAENTFSDPEFNNQSVNNNAIGVGGYYQMPPTRSFGVNLNIEF